MATDTRKVLPPIAERYAVLVHDGCVWYTVPDRRQAELMVARIERDGGRVSLAVIDYETGGVK